MKSMMTNEKNIQMLISLLRKYGIKNIIASPGSNNVNFVASLQMNDYFNVYSCVDERSAAYMACGMAAETGEPVVITCTGATASRNYIPALTEAYYRKLPIIAVTASQHLGRVGQNVPQVLDRSVQLKDMVTRSVVVNPINTDEDAWADNIAINIALNNLTQNGGGPVHINLVSTYDDKFVETDFIETRKIDRITRNDTIPVIDFDNVTVLIGNCKRITKDLEKAIEEFCEKYNGIVLCDHTSKYHGKYKVIGNIVTRQANRNALRDMDLIIEFGDVSGNECLFDVKNVWRISEDGEIRDPHKKLKKLFDMDAIEFFNLYNKTTSKTKKTSYYDKWVKEISRLYSKLSLDNMPFSNLWIAGHTINMVPEGSKVHLAILNTLRSWNYYNTNRDIDFYCNTGGFGIDGIMSSAIGASLVTDKTVYCFIGDLAFFYDMNSLGNRDIKNNLRILLINNGSGTEFHNYSHRASKISKENNIPSLYFAADGHFGNKSRELVKNYVENLGFTYLSASNKEEFENAINTFVDDKNDKSIIFEVFTDSTDESDALNYINNLDTNFKTKMVEKAKDAMSAETKSKLKKILGR